MSFGNLMCYILMFWHRFMLIKRTMLLSFWLRRSLWMNMEKSSLEMWGWMWGRVLSQWSAPVCGELNTETHIPSPQGHPLPNYPPQTQSQVTEGNEERIERREEGTKTDRKTKICKQQIQTQNHLQNDPGVPQQEENRQRSTCSFVTFF